MLTPLLDVLLLFAILTPAAGLLSRRIDRRIVGFHALTGLVLALGLLFSLWEEVATRGVVVVVLGSNSRPPVGASLAIDSLSVFMTGVHLVIGLIAAIYSVKYMENDSGLPEYYTLLLGMVAGMIGVTMAGDFFTLFIFWEIMCLASYALVAFRKERWAPVEAGYKYLIMSGAGSVTILFGMALLYGMTGTLNLAYVSSGLPKSGGGVWIYVTFFMFVAGFGLQAGMSPLHTWLPDAHAAAPSPVSAVLSGAMVKTGVYGLIRVLGLTFASSIEVWQPVMIVLAVITMFTGNILALLQDDLKRLLAFSTISNIGYVLSGLATGSLMGWTGGLLHVLNHAIVKGLLFLCAGSFIMGAGTGSLKELRGIRHKMPVTSTVFLLGTVAMAGLPTLNVFWGEIGILMAGISAGMPVFSGLIVINLALSVVYCLRLIQTIMSREETREVLRAREVPASILAPTLILASISVIIGLYPGPFRSIAEGAAQAALDAESYIIALLDV